MFHSNVAGGLAPDLGYVRIVIDLLDLLQMDRWGY